MKRDESFRPFQDLDALLKRKSFALAAPKLQVSKALPSDSKADLRLFREAMTNVKPLRRRNRIRMHVPAAAPRLRAENSDAGTMHLLNALLSEGKGFNLQDTPEYVEGAGYHAHPGLARKLHEGLFPVHMHIDLHGMGVHEALEALNAFMIRALRENQQAVLIVHGRGLSSPRMPVLKARVEEWLRRSVWRKWVLAFSSARGCDGGAGATYVLLRKRPATRRIRKTPGRKH